MPSVSIKKLTKGKRKLTVRLGKAKGVTGYRIQYSADKSFKKARTVTVGADKTSVTLKKLKPKKKYYVRVCACVKQNGTLYSSEWSKTKSKRTK